MKETIGQENLAIIEKVKTEMLLWFFVFRKIKPDDYFKKIFILKKLFNLYFHKPSLQNSCLTGRITCKC